LTQSHGFSCTDSKEDEWRTLVLGNNLIAERVRRQSLWYPAAENIGVNCINSGVKFLIGIRRNMNAAECVGDFKSPSW